MRVSPNVRDAAGIGLCTVPSAGVTPRGRSVAAVRVAGSVGPYGACLGDGSEYTGNYLTSMSRTELKVGTGREATKRPRLSVCR